jgi:alkylhydroperoxidase family enzyme
MSRIAPASPPYPPSIETYLEKLMRGRAPIVLFRVLARDERLFGRFMGGALLDRGLLSLNEREIVILRICANNRSEYEWGVHVSIFAEAAGLSPEQVEATSTLDGTAACWSERQRLLIRLCDELSQSTTLSDASWDALRAHFSEVAMLELLMLAGAYRTISILTNTLRLPLEDFAARFPSTNA